jgi:hypothetical protein
MFVLLKIRNTNTNFRVRLNYSKINATKELQEMDTLNQIHYSSIQDLWKYVYDEIAKFSAGKIIYKLLP